ncbi:MAG: fibronectin type III domain-containing protein, partial [Chitinophagaceae bacterium]
QGSAVDVDPADGPVYFDGGGIFTNGTDLGGGNFVVFDGAGTTVNVTGLTAGTTYHFAVYSYNSAGPGTINYLTPGGVNNAATTSPPLGVQLALANTSYKINFDNTLAESNTGSFNGANINTSGSSGSLNSNAWAINDIASTGAATFGTTYPLGTGLQNPGLSTASNFFGMNIGLGNVALGIQPTAAYFSPGNVTLRIQNRTGSVLTKLNLSYILYVVNDQARSNSFNFAYSTDNSLYNNQATLDYTSTVAIQNTDLRAQYRSTEITGLSIPDQGFIYLRWYGDDVAGGGSRDEFALDDIDIIANSTSVIPTISGSPENVVINTNTNAGGDITIASDLNLVNGLLTLGNNNLTTLTITGGSATSYIRTNGSGALTVNNITTGKTLPIGNAKYNPLIIENGSGHNWTAKVDDGITADGGFTTDKAVLVTWDITPSVNPTAAPADITFQFDEAATPTGQTGVNFSTGTNVQAWRRPSGAWLTTGAPAAVNTTVPNAATVKILGLSNFSPFGLSSIDGPLPVKFGNVKAYQQGNGIKVDWSNLTESGVVNYTIERSANGQLFTPLGTVNPTANNSNRADYSYFDAAPLTGINFYRIQSLEVDGKKLFSTIVRVSTKAGQTDITIYPNPVSGNRVSFQATALPKGQYMVRVTNAAGQQVMSKSLLHTGGSVTEVLELPATIKTGMYNILLSGAD